MKLCIAGGRDFNDYMFLKKEADRILKNHPNEHIIIVSGTCNGADKLGERYALENNLEVEQHPADWDKYNNAAGPIRNREMAEISDVILLFWDGLSKGTKNMRDTCLKLKKTVIAFQYTNVNNLIYRLNAFRTKIEPLVLKDDYTKLGTASKYFSKLYAECYNWWFDHNFNESDCVYPYAEYIKYLILSAFYNVLSYKGEANSFIRICRDNAKKANLKSVI